MNMTKNKTTKEKEAAGFDYPTFKQEAIAGLKAGKGLMGPEGVLKGMIGRLLSAAFEGEMATHMGSDAGLGNKRNGHTDKTLRTALGPVPVKPPRDRKGSFEPVIIKKSSTCRV